VLDFLDTWVAGGLGLGGLGLGLPQAPQSPYVFVSVGRVWTPIGSSACSVCSFLVFFTSINIFCFQQVSIGKGRVIGHERSLRDMYTHWLRKQLSDADYRALFASVVKGSIHDNKCAVLH
jgi:hypothetical protein